MIKAGGRCSWINPNLSKTIINVVFFLIFAIQLVTVEGSAAVVLSGNVAASASKIVNEIKHSRSPCYRLRKKVVQQSCQLQVLEINRKLRSAQRRGRKFKKMLRQVRGKLVKIEKKFTQSKRAIYNVQQVREHLSSRQVKIYKKAKKNMKCFLSKLKQLKNRSASLKLIVKQFEELYQKHTDTLLASLSQCRKNLKKIHTCHVSKKYFKGLPKNLFGLLKSLDVKFACLKKSSTASDKLQCMNK